MFADNWVTRDELYATGATFTVVAWGFAYLCITTMTSTGLSDIIAVESHARAFVLLQQIAGMLYVALVVARLVGLTIARFRQ